jgi:hypothetical protein
MSDPPPATAEAVKDAVRSALAAYISAHGRPTIGSACEFVDEFADWLYASRRALYARALELSINGRWILENTEFTDSDSGSETDTDASVEDERYQRIVAALDTFVASSLIYVPRKIGARVNLIGAFRRWLRENDVALLAAVGDDDYLLHWAIAALASE